MAARAILASVDMVGDVLNAVDALDPTAKQVYLQAAIGIAVGVALLVLGLKLSRVVVALGGAALGFVVAPWVAHRLGTYRGGGTSFRVTQGIMAFCMSILAIVDSRLLWSLFAAGTSVAVAGVAMVATPIQITATPPAAESWAGKIFVELAPSCQQGWLYVHSFATAFWSQYGTIGLLVPSCAVAVLVLALIFAKPAQIAMTSLLGSAMMTGGGLLLVRQHHRSLWDQAKGNSLAVLGVVAGVTLVGMVIQRLLNPAPKQPLPPPGPPIGYVPPAPTGPRTH